MTNKICCELKPCPFCGSIDDVDSEGWLDGNGKTGPECLNCGATARSISNWNERSLNNQNISDIAYLLLAQTNILIFKSKNHEWCRTTEKQRKQINDLLEKIESLISQS